MTHNESLACFGTSPLTRTTPTPAIQKTRQLANGFKVIRQDGDSIYLTGYGSSPEGDRPFLDRLDLKTLKSERLFRSDQTCYEKFLSFTGPGREDVPHLASIAGRSSECICANTWPINRCAPPEKRSLLQPASRSPTCPIRRRRCGRSRSGWSSTSATTGLTCRSRSIRRPAIRKVRASPRFFMHILSTMPVLRQPDRW